ncbi:MAG TPA: phosphoribosylamine--glycine ligase, partial [Thermoanaerobaculia bacterium]|nr:phosphoribosylamine--glycine ligase [Thermoanaerobaculia bacterium]
QVALAQREKIDFVVVGPEVPLAAGLADRLAEAGLKVFGPSAKAAQLESSKGFTKELCRRHNIPTGAYERFTDADEAVSYIRAQGAPIVVKADGLAAGKGVVVAETVDQAIEAARDMLSGNRFGTAGASVVIEEFLVGEEASFFALCDGEHALPLVGAQDHKRAFDGDKGPNTGGMGAYSPVPILDQATFDCAMREIVLPTAKAMKDAGTPFQGVLYAGLMIGKDRKPRLVEYNCRFGDPETQVQMLRLEDDLADVCLKVARGNLGDTKLNWLKEAAACVVIAVDGYPNEFPKGQEVVVDPIDDPSVTVFHAGTIPRGGRMVNVAGRVASVCARAATLSEALAKAYEAAPKVRFEGARYRTDIGYRALEQRKG